MFYNENIILNILEIFNISMLYFTFLFITYIVNKIFTYVTNKNLYLYTYIPVFLILLFKNFDLSFDFYTNLIVCIIISIFMFKQIKSKKFVYFNMSFLIINLIISLNYSFFYNSLNNINYKENEKNISYQYHNYFSIYDQNKKSLNNIIINNRVIDNNKTGSRIFLYLYFFNILAYLFWLVIYLITYRKHNFDKGNK